MAGSSRHHCTSGDVAFGILVLVLELYFFAMADAAVDSVTALSKLLKRRMASIAWCI